MRKTTVAILAVLLAALGLYLAGCSQSSDPSMSDPNIDPTTSIATSIASSEMTLLRSAGVGIEGKGLLIIGWREMFNPCLDTAIAVGRAIAIGYDSVGKSLKKGGVDMGSVSLDYASTHIAMTKHSSRKNVIYSSSAGPKNWRTNVGFVGNTLYTFDISGSSDFSALNASINSPAALIMLTSPVHKDTVSSSGLTLTWTGGGDSSIIIAVAAVPPPFVKEKDDDDDHDGDHDDDHHDGDDDDQGEHDGGATVKAGDMDGVDHHHHNKHHKDHKFEIEMPPGGFPPMLDSTKAIIVKLNSNPGTYTVDAAALNDLILRTGARRLSCSVSQLILNDVSHDGGTVHLVIRNGDGVTIKVKK